jgi:hypothetical protein
MANLFCYLAHLLQAFWMRFLSLMSASHRTTSSADPNFPTLVPDDVESQPNELGNPSSDSWRAEKAQFMRSPSLVRSTRPRREATERKLTTKVQRNAPATIHSTQVGTFDWKSLNYKISVPPARLPLRGSFPPRSMALVNCVSPTLSAPRILLTSSPTSTPGFATATSAENHPARDLHLAAACTAINDRRALSALLKQSLFAPTCYASNPRSAVAGLLLDVPSSKILHSIPLPLNCISNSAVDPLTTDTGARAHLLPYPDLFDFSMYDRRASDRGSALGCSSGSQARIVDGNMAWDAAFSGLFTFGVASAEGLPAGCALGLDLSTPPLRIMKRGCERSGSAE